MERGDSPTPFAVPWSPTSGAGIRAPDKPEIAFEVEGEPAAVLSCNCSICARKGALLWVVPRAQLRLLAPEAGVGTFNNHVIRHRFCQTCGLHPFAESGNADDVTAYNNLRCPEDLDQAPFRAGGCPCRRLGGNGGSS